MWRTEYASSKSWLKYEEGYINCSKPEKDLKIQNLGNIIKGWHYE